MAVGCWNHLNKRLASPGDDPSSIFKKNVIAALFLVGILAAVRDLADARALSIVGGAVGLVLGGGNLAYLLRYRQIHYYAVEGYLYYAGLRFLFGDLRMVVMSHSRMWPFFIILIDVCLLLHFKPRVTRVLLASCTAWLVLLGTEDYFRFGLYDIPNLPTQADRHAAFDCADYPCSRASAPVLDTLFIQLFVLFLDFYFTRTFANGLHKEHEEMNAAICATERIASALSHFDLTSAEAILNTATLTPPLDTAFRSILANLLMYRPYIPEAIFAQSQNDSEICKQDVAAPGLTTGLAAIVFTDIQGSTATWEACPDGMRAALEVHSTVIRDCLSAHGGYEVKTIGDAFMAAFDSARSAVRFSLLVQEKLVYAPWPAALLELEHCRWMEDGPWCGLRVRIGVHCGEVDMQLNKVTGRYDYFGHAVNKAARMEGVCVAGTVAVTTEVLEEAGDLTDQCIIIEKGLVEMKGLGAVRTFLLLKQELIGRHRQVEELMHMRIEDKIFVIDVSPTASSASSLISVQPSTSLKSELNLVQAATVGVGEIVLHVSEVEEMTESLNKALDKVVTCTERTHGTIGSLHGSRVTAVWNGPKGCVTHVENSLAFVRMMGAGWDTGEHGMHVGVATGSVVCGAVGGRRQKFVAVLGACVGVGSTLCTDAARNGVLCYYAAGTIPSCLSEIKMRAEHIGTFTASDGTLMHQVEIAIDTEYLEYISIRRGSPGIRKSSWNVY